MFNSSKKFALAFSLLALTGFLFLSSGGQYLHNKIHHHATQSAQDECPLQQLLVQMAVAITGTVIVLYTATAFRATTSLYVFVLKPHQVLFNLRSPPAFV